MSLLVKCDGGWQRRPEKARVVIAELNLGTPALAKALARWYQMVPAFLLTSHAD